MSPAAPMRAFTARTSNLRSASAREPGINKTDTPSEDISAENLSLRLPSGAPLLAASNLALKHGIATLISGASGSGKSTLFRAFAGLWPFGAGTVRMPAGARVMFLPQKPYLIIGTLREQLAYPDDASHYNDATLMQTLDDCGLPALKSRLDETQHWAQQLSGGEQQRIAIARALLHQPDWLFLDEATASLDEASEARVYELLRGRLPHCTVVSIGHRSSLKTFHPRQINVLPGAGGAHLAKA